jgi:hypothetical protein
VLYQKWCLHRDPSFDEWFQTLAWPIFIRIHQLKKISKKELNSKTKTQQTNKNEMRTSNRVQSGPPAMWRRTLFAPFIVTSSSKGWQRAFSVAIIALSFPSASPKTYHQKFIRRYILFENQRQQNAEREEKRQCVRL